jgi:integrase
MGQFRIDTAAARSRLEQRREPYWMPISDVVGAAVGFRRGPDTWVARLRDEATGGQRYHALGKFADHREAVKAAREWIKSKDQGVVAFDKTVGDACRAYIENVRIERGAKPAQEVSARLLRSVLGRTFKTREIPPNSIAQIQLSKLRPYHIESFRNSLLEKHVDGGEPSNAEQVRKARASANREMTALVAALNYAYRMRMCASNSAWTTVKKFADTQAPKTSRRLVTLSDRRKLLAAASGGVRDFLEGLMLLGARPIELCRLKVTDFDPTTGSLTLTSYKGRSAEPKHRTIPLRAFGAVDLIMRLCRRKLPAAPIFTRDDGLPWGHSDWDKDVQEARKAAGLRYITAYDLRHSWITEALSGGVDPSTVAELAGTSITMLNRTYAHLVVDHAIQAFAAVRLL